MPDPLHVLPYELWSLCIGFAIDGQQAGPLELIMVSKRWENLLLDSPSLWSQIYLQNGEDEMARISTFLHLSKSSPLHVDIMTVLPTMDSLQLIAENISRVGTISIRPGPAPDTKIALHTKQWEQAASYIMATVFNGSLPSHASCLGVSLRESNQLNYHIILMEFTMAPMVAISTHKQDRVISANSPNIWTCFRMWKEHVARCAYIAQP